MEALVELFKKNTWATLQLLDACASLSDEQLALMAPGTYGSIKDTLTHICAAEQRYVWRLSGGPAPADLRDFPGIPDLRQRAQRSGERLQELALRARPGETFEREYDGKRYSVEKVVVLVQVIDHGHEHRAHVKTVLSVHGIEPPEIDGWTYGEATGRMKAVG
jgi:uncharacterized damage-inducible protein DinB